MFREFNVFRTLIPILKDEKADGEKVNRLSSLFVVCRCELVLSSYLVRIGMYNLPNLSPTMSINIMMTCHIAMLAMKNFAERSESEK